MLPCLLTAFCALLPTTDATPMHTSPHVIGRDSITNTKTTGPPMSTEAVIGLVGVIVAFLGIALPLAWMKWRRRFGGERRTPFTENGQSTENGAILHTFLEFDVKSDEARYSASEPDSQYIMDDLTPLPHEATQDWSRVHDFPRRTTRHGGSFRYERLVVHSWQFEDGRR